MPRLARAGVFFIYIKNMSTAEEKIELKSKLVEYFKERPEIDAAILFGSLANGKLSLIGQS